MDARYGLGVVKQALSGAMQAGSLRHQDVDILALTEAAMVIARSPSPSKSRKAAERAIGSVIAGWRRPN
jgi:hypothetical protein